MKPASVFALLSSLALAACGGPHSGIEHPAHPAGQPPAITDENVHSVELTYWRMAPDDPARIAWRDALVAYRARDADALMTQGDYDAIVQTLTRVSELLVPSDLDGGRVPATVAPLARWLLEHAARRGDEGRAMGALLLLAAMSDQADARRAEHARIAQWGRDARNGIGNPIERFGDLIEVWEQHEELAPSPEVLATLARLYVEQRDALTGAFGPEGQGNSAPGRLSFQELRLAPLLVQRAPLDVAAVYLRHGDLGSAVAHVQRMGERGDVEFRLVQILERAQRDDDGGAQALDELARGFARARPGITSAICRLGVRRFANDARFPLCLARVALETESFGEATAWYAEAVRLAPDEREVYDEALGRLDQVMEDGLFETDVAQSRAIARHALQILEERSRRWPDAAASVSRHQLLLSAGRAEMSAGDVDAARRRLTESLAVRESREAHLALGLLLERTDEPREAADHYRRALDLTDEQGEEGTSNRAEILEHLGDSFRQAGDESQAERMYRQALGLWESVLEGLRGARVAVVHVRRGILSSRLGDDAAAQRAFELAMESAPSWREPYAAILAHLVVSSRPNLDLAQTVLRRAQYQLTLEPEWRVYFALWVQAIAARAAGTPEGEVRSMLSEFARGEGWSSRLAAFGGGQLSYEELERAARDVGERTEAHFYQGVRLLGTGDLPGARSHLERVVRSGMVNYYEFAMAQELLARLTDSDGSVAEQSP